MVNDMKLWSQITPQNMDGGDILKQHTLFQAIRSDKSLRYYQKTQQHLQNSLNLIDRSTNISMAKFDLEKSAMNSRRTQIIRDKLRISRRSRELRNAGIPSLADLVRHQVPGQEMGLSFTSWASDGVPRYVRRYDFKERPRNIPEKGDSMGIVYDLTLDSVFNYSETDTGKGVLGNRHQHKAKTNQHRNVNCNRTIQQEIGDAKYFNKTIATSLQVKQLNSNGVNQPESKEYGTNLDRLNIVLDKDIEPASLDVTIHRTTHKVNDGHRINTMSLKEAHPFGHKLPSTHKFLSFGASQKATNLDIIFKLEHRGSENDLAFLRDMNRRRVLKKFKADFNELSKLVNNFSIS